MISSLTVESLVYHGWSNSLRLSNNVVEAFVVPAIGRVMDFRRIGDSEGCFWQNRALDGQLHPAHSADWINFGGDKSWPAPQSEWPRYQGHGWPPPAAFDAERVAAERSENGIVLISPIDAGYGIQVTRRIELDPTLAQMRIHTEYKKLKGSPTRVSIWTITQMNDPVCVAMELPAHSRHAEGFVRLLDPDPLALHRAEGSISFARSHMQMTKIGTEAAAMLWVGKGTVARIASLGELSGEFPDHGSVSEIYTNADPLPYVELETLGPLVELSVGQSAARTAVYTLAPRTCADPQEEIRCAFQRP